MPRPRNASSASHRERLRRLRKPLRLAFIGGAAPSMIGQAHLRAALMDRCFTADAGVLPRNAARGVEASAEYGIAPDRSYASVEHMIALQTQRADEVEAVAIVTPNDTQRAFALAAIAVGLDVIVDKPLINSAAESEDVARAATARGVALCLTHG